jgi:hypothetical protein
MAKEESYPEGFDKSCGIPAAAVKAAMLAANQVLSAVKTGQKVNVLQLAQAMMFYAEEHKLQPFLIEHLKLWKDSGVPTPANELQSISAWMEHLDRRGKDLTLDAMRKRSILLMQQANALHQAGPEAEDQFGIFENRSREDFDRDSNSGGAES